MGTFRFCPFLTSVILMAMVAPATASAQTREDSILWEKQLAAVTIKGTQSQYKQKGGAIVARISGTSLEKEPTTTDVLGKLPGMFLKDGKPQAFIGGTPEIYINDKKVQDYSVVENLPVTLYPRPQTWLYRPILLECRIGFRSFYPPYYRSEICET